MRAPVSRSRPFSVLLSRAAVGFSGAAAVGRELNDEPRLEGPAGGL
jgi:hypothetical protein